MSKQQKPKKLPTNRILVEQQLNARYDFRHNAVTNQIYWRYKNGKSYSALTDYDINSIHRALTNANIKVGIGSLRNLLLSDFSTYYNPYTDYFNSLPPQDGHDYIADLARTLTAKNSPYWEFCFRKWFVAMVASLVKSEAVNHTTIVIIGDQGIGKTTWLIKLIPKELATYISTGKIDLNNKDTLLALSENILIILDEIDSFTKNELAKLKETITKSKIRIRRPYGVIHETIYRRASFAASINSPEFLHDLTGNRRFLCVEAIEINLNHKVDLNKAYAQAYDMVKTGFQYWFETDEIAELEKHNQAFRVICQEEELLSYYFEPCSEAEADNFMSSTDIISFLRDRSGINLSHGALNKLGKILRAHKFLRLKKNQRYVYALKQKSTVVGILESGIRTLEEILN